MTIILIYQRDGYIDISFPPAHIGAAASPPNARLFVGYDNLILCEHRSLAQLEVFASGEHFLSASVKISVQTRLAPEAKAVPASLASRPQRQR